jgi:RNase P subunit RPR2
MPERAVKSRLHRGWSEEEALTIPVADRGLTSEERQRREQARQALAYAVRTGKVEKPTCCETCNKELLLQAHHYRGYVKQHQLTVVWLCTTCHGRRRLP